MNWEPVGLNIYEIMEKFGLTLFTEVSPQGDGYHAVVTKYPSPWPQEMAKDSRVILADVTAPTAQEAVNNAVEKARKKMEEFT